MANFPFWFQFCFLDQTKKELSDGELDSENEGGKPKTSSNAGSNALASLMSYASDSEGEGKGIKKSTITIALLFLLQNLRFLTF
jgi:hypothetical protein